MDHPHLASPATRSIAPRTHHGPSLATPSLHREHPPHYTCPLGEVITDGASTPGAGQATCDKLWYAQDATQAGTTRRPLRGDRFNDRVHARSLAPATLERSGSAGPCKRMGREVARRTPCGPPIPDGRGSSPRHNALERGGHADHSSHRKVAGSPARGPWAATSAGKSRGGLEDPLTRWLAKEK
jgi:hypothetical protein